MKHNVFILVSILCCFPLVVVADDQANLQREVQHLQQQTQDLQAQLSQLQKQLVKQNAPKKLGTRLTEKHGAREEKRGSVNRSTRGRQATATQTLPAASSPSSTKATGGVHSSTVTVHRLDNDPESLEFYPTALVADEHIVTYIAGTPIVASPYLGSRPAFDGSDYIVNISSINRDIRLMQQRRRLYRAYEKIGYPIPHQPIIAISGKVEPLATLGSGDAFFANPTGDLTLGSSELDIAAILNDKIEAYIALSADTSAPALGGQRLSNAAVDLNMGFVNIGDLDETPFYMTAGQLFVPFGRYSTSMVSAPLTMIMARTKARPVILGYKSRHESGPFAAIYGFKSDTTLNSTAVGGVNLGYVFDTGYTTGEIGASYISAMNNSGGMQFTGSTPAVNTGTFGGFSSFTNGNEAVRKIPAFGVHGYLSVDRYNFTAEWVGATGQFRPEDLSFNGRGARPQAGQLEASVTFKTFDKPASVGVGYQWSKQTLALNLPRQRINGVFNISIWKDTVESLEYRHDFNYATTQYANGAAPLGQVNANTYGPGGATDTLLAQIGVYF